MDGSNRYGIIKSKLGWPSGITLDIEAQRVYWVDSRYDYIETTTYSGLHRYAYIMDYTMDTCNIFYSTILYFRPVVLHHRLILIIYIIDLKFRPPTCQVTVSVC